MTKKELEKQTKKHTDVITIKLDYDKGSLTPDGVHIEADCTILDYILAAMTLYEAAMNHAKENADSSLVPFIVNCADAQAQLEVAALLKKNK